MVLNTNLTGFSFSKNLLSILTSFELINLYPFPPQEIIKKPYISRVIEFFPITIFAKRSILDVLLYFHYTNLIGNPPLGNHDDFRKNLLGFLRYL